MRKVGEDLGIELAGPPLVADRVREPCLNQEPVSEDLRAWRAPEDLAVRGDDLSAAPAAGPEGRKAQRGGPFTDLAESVLGFRSRAAASKNARARQRLREADIRPAELVGRPSSSAGRA